MIICPSVGRKTDDEALRLAIPDGLVREPGLLLTVMDQRATTGALPVNVPETTGQVQVVSPEAPAVHRIADMYLSHREDRHP